MSEESRKTGAGRLGLWKGAFGDAYTGRNAPKPALIEARARMWSRILSAIPGTPPASILEVGANLGLNLRALGRVTAAELYALEPNAKARAILEQHRVVPKARILDGTAEAIPLADASVDLAFTCGVLIHIAPDDLPGSCREIHRVVRRYIGCIEYFSDKPETIPYRGHVDLLFKRDFGAFWLDNFGDLALLDYGFFWKRASGMDNLTWWLFEKR